MQNNFLGKLLLIALFLHALTGCQKDANPLTNAEQDTQNVLQTTTLTDRATYIYGVTVWTTTVASKVVKIDFATGLVAGWVNVTSGATLIKDLKGICTVGAEYYVTTGTNNTAAFQYKLLKIDPNTGAVLSVFNPGYAAPISDICFRDVTPLGIYGLKDNSNNPVRINYNAGTWSTTTTFPPLPLPASYTASGLCWAKSTPTYQIFIAANDAGGNVRLYTWDPATLATIAIVGLTPNTDYVGANLGLGYYSIGGIGLINRRPTSPGLNKIPWGPVAGTGLWGGVGYNFEDMCTVQ